MEPVSITIAVVALVGTIVTGILHYLSESKFNCSKVTSECCVFKKI
jgi:hypothetical protein